MGGVFSGHIDPRALPDLTQRAHSAHRVAATVTAAFVVAGLAWVLLHRRRSCTPSATIRALIARIETAKGWIFIGAGQPAAVRGRRFSARRAWTASGA